MEIFRKKVKDAEMFQVTENGETLGFAMTSKNDGQTVNLDSIHVIPSKRKQGIGKSLLTNIFSWAQEQGATQIEGDFYPEFRGGKDEENARKFYHEHGFEIDDKNKLHKKLG